MSLYQAIEAQKKEDEIFSFIAAFHKITGKTPYTMIWSKEFDMSPSLAWKYNQRLVEKKALIPAGYGIYILNKRLPKRFKKMYEDAK